MISLSIDPAFGKSRKASKVGFAYMKDGVLLDHGQIPVIEAEDWALRRHMLATAAVLIVEGQHVDKNVAVTEGLIEARCLWAVPARDHFNMEVVKMHPSEWQSRADRHYYPGRPVNREEISRYVRLRFNLRNPGSDEISAIAMGAVWWDRERLKSGAAR